MRIDLEAATNFVKGTHTYGLVGLDEMYPECSCGESVPCAERELAIELIERVRELEAAAIQVGSVPPWMEQASNSSCDCPEANGSNRDCGVCDVEHWRMRQGGES